MGLDWRGGYTGSLARIDLSAGCVRMESWSEAERREWLGGTGLGVKLLWDEVPAQIAWNHPDNRVAISGGPLSGTGFPGAGGYSMVSIGPMTGSAGCTQANGFLGAYLKRCGFDGLIIQGISPEWVYILVDEGKVELKSAARLLGLDTFETARALEKELGLKSSQLSTACIGPAGENLVRFACVSGDDGHVASKNGMGAVLGKKKLKAIAVKNGALRHAPAEPEVFQRVRSEAAAAALKEYGGMFHREGTGCLIHIAHETGVLPVKNYQTNVYPDYKGLDASYTRRVHGVKLETCFACPVKHCATVTIKEGPFKGLVAPEPEYEGIAALGSMPQIGDYGSVVHLNTLADGLGLDVNECGWVIGLVLEGLQTGRLSPGDLGGLSTGWGDAKGVEAILRMTAARQGIGDILAEGVKRAAARLGGWALDSGIYVNDGSTPRGHDHRGRWAEMLDTCVSGTGTLESTFGGPGPEMFGWEPVSDMFDGGELGRANAKVNGWRLIEDCLMTCRFAVRNPDLIMRGLNSVTGWGLSLEDLFTRGRRMVNLLRLIKLGRGHTAADESPSRRYGSTPVDGPAKGRAVAEQFEEMKRAYYAGMGWDPENGRPLDETLAELGIELK